MRGAFSLAAAPLAVIALVIGALLLQACPARPPSPLNEDASAQQRRQRQAIGPGPHRTVSSSATTAASPPTPPQPSPTVVPTPLPGEFGAGPWGPLAVIAAPSDAGELAALRGTLHIGEACVTVGELDPVVPIFRNSQTRWDADRRAIVFYNFHDRTVVELRDGDWVSFGGGEIGPRSSGITWLARPNRSCPAQIFGVHGASP